MFFELLNQNVSAMKMLVTDATGFIGSHLAERLLVSGHEVRGLVRTPEKGAELSRLGVELVRGDVTDPASLSQHVRGIDIVFHAPVFTGFTFWHRSSTLFICPV